MHDMEQYLEKSRDLQQTDNERSRVEPFASAEKEGGFRGKN